MTSHERTANRRWGSTHNHVYEPSTRYCAGEMAVIESMMLDSVDNEPWSNTPLCLALHRKELFSLTTYNQLQRGSPSPVHTHTRIAQKNTSLPIPHAYHLLLHIKMNTLSLVLNGRTASEISVLPERQRSSLTRLTRKFSSSISLPTLATFGSAPPSPLLSGASALRSSRPGSSRRSSRDSPGWYNTEHNPTLDDFARRLETRMKRFEIWRGKSAQNVVMALMRPTPIVLFLFNPIALALWFVLLVWWLSSGLASAG